MSDVDDDIRSEPDILDESTVQLQLVEILTKTDDIEEAGSSSQHEEDFRKVVHFITAFSSSPVIVKLGCQTLEKCCSRCSSDERTLSGLSSLCDFLSSASERSLRIVSAQSISKLVHCLGHVADADSESSYSDSLSALKDRLDGLVNDFAADNILSRTLRDAVECITKAMAPAVQVHDPASQSAEDNDDEEEEGHGEGASNSVTGDGDGDGVGDDGGAVPEGNSPTVTFTVTAGNTAINADSGTGEGGGGGGGLPLTGFLDNMAQLRPLQRHALEFLRHNLNPHRWGEISRRLENFYRPNITSPQTIETHMRLNGVIVSNIMQLAGFKCKQFHIIKWENFARMQEAVRVLARGGPAPAPPRNTLGNAMNALPYVKPWVGDEAEEGEEEEEEEGQGPGGSYSRRAASDDADARANLRTNNDHKRKVSNGSSNDLRSPEATNDHRDDEPPAQRARTTQREDGDDDRDDDRDGNDGDDVDVDPIEREVDFDADDDQPQSPNNDDHEGGSRSRDDDQDRDRGEGGGDDQERFSGSKTAAGAGNEFTGRAGRVSRFSDRFGARPVAAAGGGGGGFGAGDRFDGRFPRDFDRDRNNNRRDSGGNANLNHDDATAFLLIRNLPVDVRIEELVKLIRNTGCSYIETKDVTIPPPKRGVNDRGGELTAHAYINFQHIKDSRQARTQLDGKIFGGRTLELEYSLGRPSKVVWVGGIGDKLSEGDIHEKLRSFGRIDKVDIKRRKLTGDAFAFVEFESVQDAQRAVKTLKGSAFIRGVTVRIGFSSSSKDQPQEDLQRGGGGGGRGDDFGRDNNRGGDRDRDHREPLVQPTGRDFMPGGRGGGPLRDAGRDRRDGDQPAGGGWDRDRVAGGGAARGGGQQWDRNGSGLGPRGNDMGGGADRDRQQQFTRDRDTTRIARQDSRDGSARDGAGAGGDRYGPRDSGARGGYDNRDNQSLQDRGATRDRDRDTGGNLRYLLVSQLQSREDLNLVLNECDHVGAYVQVGVSPPEGLAALLFRHADEALAAKREIDVRLRDKCLEVTLYPANHVEPALIADADIAPPAAGGRSQSNRNDSRDRDMREDVAGGTSGRKRSRERDFDHRDRDRDRGDRGDRDRELSMRGDNQAGGSGSGGSGAAAAGGGRGGGAGGPKRHRGTDDSIYGGGGGRNRQY